MKLNLVLFPTNNSVIFLYKRSPIQIKSGGFLFNVYLSYMKIVLTESQYQKVVFNLLDVLYGPKLTYGKEDDRIKIFSNEGEHIFTVYTVGGRGDGCKLDMFVNFDTGNEINNFIPKIATRKKLFSRTVLSYVNEKTNLDIDCIEFWYEMGPSHDDKRYNFSVKKNKKIKRTTK